MEKNKCTNIQAFKSGKVLPLIPPHKTPEQKALVSFLLSIAEKDHLFSFPLKDKKRFYMAVVKDGKNFEKFDQISRKMNQAYINQVKSQTLEEAIAGELIMVSAAKV